MYTLISRIIANKFYPPSNPTDLSFKNRTIIVTGSNTGLGYFAAAKFATQSCSRLIVAVRNAEAGARAQTVLQHLATNPECKVELWPLDMADYRSIVTFVERVERECERVDVAVLNAGVWRSDFVCKTREEGGYGWEECLLVNCLGTVLLAVGLLRVMRAKWRARGSRRKTSTTAGESGTSSEENSSPQKQGGEPHGEDNQRPVLELVSSGRYARPNLITPEQLATSDINILASYNTSADFSAGKQYAASKLFLMCAYAELAHLAQAPSHAPPSDSTPDGQPSNNVDGNPEPDVYVQAVCPGACQSALSRDLDSLAIKVARFYANNLFLRTTEEGSRTLISGTALDTRGHGQFWQSDGVKSLAPALCGDDGEKLQKRVWGEICEVLARDVEEFGRWLADMAR